MTKMERWLAYFANQLDNHGKEELAMSDTAIQNAMEAARLFLNSTEERRQYINREMARMDYESRLQQKHRDGLQQGAEQEANRYNKLMQILMSKGDMETIQEVIKDNTKRIELYKKYHLV